MMKARRFYLLSAALIVIYLPHSFSFQPIINQADRCSQLSAKAKKIEVEEEPSAQTFVRSTSDGNVVLDHNGTPLTVARFLATEPLQGDLQTRPGPGGMQLTYLSGTAVISTLNQAFGYDGWNLQVIEKEQVICDKGTDGRWNAGYTAHVRITLTDSGTFHEDFGIGDAVDRQQVAAVQMALKASITDGVKRAARHFGDKLGNCLYQSNFEIKNAPKNLVEALDKYDKKHPRGL